jgi:catechol 2,3-dioxygenase-like lactoylglutathione lyase family enzyme
MRLNTLQLMVADIEAATLFLTTYFGLAQQPAGPDSSVALTDEAGLVLTLVEGQDHAYPKGFHIGFALPSESEVAALRQRLDRDGQQPSEPAEGQDGAFYVMAPGGMMIEVRAAR